SCTTSSRSLVTRRSPRRSTISFALGGVISSSPIRTTTSTSSRSATTGWRGACDERAGSGAQAMRRILAALKRRLDPRYAVQAELNVLYERVNALQQQNEAMSQRIEQFEAQQERLAAELRVAVSDLGDRLGAVRARNQRGE